MANVIGSGSPLFASWSVPSPARTLAAATPSRALEEEPRRALPPGVLSLLERVSAVLQPHPAGLALAQLREALGVAAPELRSAIDAGLRRRSLRRVGASSTLRYVLNPSG